MTGPDAIVLELRAVRADLAALAEAHEHVLRRLLERDDRRTGSVLVPLLADAFEGEPFTVAGVAARALNDRTAGGQALREVIADQLSGDDDLRAFGGLLVRLQGVCFDGCRLVRVGRRGNVVLWSVRRRGGPTAAETPDA